MSLRVAPGRSGSFRAALGRSGPLRIALSRSGSPRVAPGRSESLRAVVSQRLVPNAEGTDRIPALELLVINRAIGNMIRDEKTTQIRSSMQTGKAHGMYLLEQCSSEMRFLC